MKNLGLALLVCVLTVVRISAFLPSQRSSHNRRVQYYPCLQCHKRTDLSQGLLPKRNGPECIDKSIAATRNAAKSFSGLQMILIRVTTRMQRFFHRCNSRQLLTLLFSFAMIFMRPHRSNASTVDSLPNANSRPQSESVEYYLQNDPRRSSSSKSQQKILSIQTKSSSILAPSHSRRSNKGRLRTDRPARKTTQQIASGIVLASLAAGSFRAKLRKHKVVRTATPFGRIRNTSPLGNGVSVIRLRMALEFEQHNGPDSIDSNSFLEKLQIEEYNLYSTIALLAQQQKLNGLDVYGLKQKALVKYLVDGEFPLVCLLHDSCTHV